MSVHSVWMAMPVADAKRGQASVKDWQAKGFKVAVLLDNAQDTIKADYVVYRGEYMGYWASVNELSRRLMYKGAEIVVWAADDIDPPKERSKDDLADQFLQRFPGGFGLMQPCGDQQGKDHTGKPAAERICGSPWVGKDWINRAYGGHHPSNPAYFHFFGDEELYEVATKQDALWMRPDVTQFHKHWSWGHRKIADYNQRNQTHWGHDKALYEKRKVEGFPGHEPKVS